jgi:hypothetical protein
VEHLAELEHMVLALQRQVAAHEHQHAARVPRGLAVHRRHPVLALLERQPVELGADGARAHVLLPLEREHGALLVQPRQRRPVGVERRVVVLHKRLAQRIGIHCHVLSLSLSLTLRSSPPLRLFGLSSNARVELTPQQLLQDDRNQARPQT